MGPLLKLRKPAVRGFFSWVFEVSDLVFEALRIIVHIYVCNMGNDVTTSEIECAVQHKTGLGDVRSIFGRASKTWVLSMLA